MTVPDIARRATSEGVGTFFLVLIGPGAAMVDGATHGALGHTGVALAFGFVVAAMIYATGHLSGAHINPAVTLAFWSAGRFPARDVAPYVLAQCTGAVLASLALRAVLGTAGGLGATVPAVPLAAAFGVEWILSFGLMFVIIAVATGPRETEAFAGLAVGLTVAFAALTGGPLTGASMNPARSLGPAVAGGFWEAHWLYWLAPVTAMLAAVRVYAFLRAGEALHPSRATAPHGVEGPVQPSSPPFTS